MLLLIGPMPADRAGLSDEQPVERPEAQLLEDPTAVVAGASIGPWIPIFVGVEKCDASSDQPRPLQVRAVRIDLQEHTIRFLVTPSNGDEPLDCNARTTSQFLQEFHCQIAINGSAFDPFAEGPHSPQDVVGLSLSRGDLYSPANEFDALLISEDHRAWIDDAPIDAAGAHHGLSGFHALLREGQNQGEMQDHHPRSAVGVTQDGRYLILMAIDGRQDGYSEGTSTAETAEWIRRLGAFHALNLDGGGSTALVIEGTDGQPQLLNRPSGGTERLVANHLGVFAQHLPDARPAEAPVINDAPPWIVQGRVTDTRGNGLSNVEIRAATGAGTLLGGGTTTTDHQGHYVLHFGPGMSTQASGDAPMGVGVQAASIFASKPGWFEANLCRQGDLVMTDRTPETVGDGAKVWGKQSLDEVVFPKQPRTVNFIMGPAVALEGELVETSHHWDVPKQRLYITGPQLPPSSSALAQHRDRPWRQVRLRCPADRFRVAVRYARATNGRRS